MRHFVGINKKAEMINNLVFSDNEKDFWVWVDPKNFLIKHQVGLIGSFISVNILQDRDNLMFIPNPNFHKFISPFQNNLIINYRAEYNLEIDRKKWFNNYPSRLESIFLFDIEEETHKYYRRHLEHVGNRLLKKVKTNGQYLFSKHDSSWIDFLRIGHSMDIDTINNISKSYWSGDLVINNKLSSMGNVWSQEPIFEILFIGRIDFYDRSLTKSQNGA